MKTTTEPKVQQTAIGSLYDEVSNRIIAMIENGVVPWRKTWSTYGLARNYISGRLYTGINYILMNNTGHPIPYFATFNQIKELGGRIKKGAEANMVIYFKMYYKDSDDKTLAPEVAKGRYQKGEDIRVLKFIRYYNVFNVEDIEDVEIDNSRFPEVRLEDNEKITRCEEIIMNMPNPPNLRQIDANRAFYSPAQDFINLPSIGQFESSEHYYATYFHELIHATGHPSRLARNEVMDFSGFGSKPYSKEELVAEMGASFLSCHCQIDYDSVIENNASYLAGWLNVLKEDPRFIFKVSSEVQKAIEHILNQNRFICE
jgi:antirestriction protein ArdC